VPVPGSGGAGPNVQHDVLQHVVERKEGLHFGVNQVDYSATPHDARLHVVEDGLEGLAPIASGQSAADLPQLLGAGTGERADGASGDPARLRHHHREGAVLAQADQLDAVEGGAPQRRSEKHPGHVRTVREQAGRPRHEPLRGVGRGSCRLGGRSAHFDGFPRHLAKGVHVVAIGPVGRHAPGRGVGMGEIAHVLEVGHGVANCRGRQALNVAPRYGAGTYGLGGLHVLRDDREEHLAQALVETRRGHLACIVTD
jgi:hypothetical protein